MGCESLHVLIAVQFYGSRTVPLRSVRQRHCEYASWGLPPYPTSMLVGHCALTRLKLQNDNSLQQSEWRDMCSLPLLQLWCTKSCSCLDWPLNEAANKTYTHPESRTLSHWAGRHVHSDTR